MKLILRPLATDHVKAVLAGNRRDHWAPDYPDEGDRIIAKMLAAEFRPGQYQIIERSTGLVVGGIGIFWPATDGAVEFGYGVVPSRRGLGYATEAAGRILQVAFDDPAVHQVYADVEGDNPASVRVLEKSGLRQIGPTRYAIQR
jgi:RimJ/RimL family protein N-acetyltransferase